jgi:hypothetical protein
MYGAEQYAEQRGAHEAGRLMKVPENVHEDVDNRFQMVQVFHCDKRVIDPGHSLRSFPTMATLMISGSVGITQKHLVFNRIAEALDYWSFTARDIALLVTGKAAGVDAAAREWAMFHDVPVEFYQPDEYNRDAINTQNDLMLARATHVIAVWDGVSPGTKHAIEGAERLGKVLKVFRV